MADIWNGSFEFTGKQNRKCWCRMDGILRCWASSLPMSIIWTTSSYWKHNSQFIFTPNGTKQNRLLDWDFFFQFNSKSLYFVFYFHSQTVRRWQVNWFDSWPLTSAVRQLVTWLKYLRLKYDVSICRQSLRMHFLLVHRERWAESKYFATMFAVIVAGCARVYVIMIAESILLLKSMTTYIAYVSVA